MASERAAWWCCWWQILRPDRRLRPPALSSLPYRPRVIRHVRPLTEGVGEWRLATLQHTLSRERETLLSVSVLHALKTCVSARNVASEGDPDSGPERPLGAWPTQANAQLGEAVATASQLSGKNEAELWRSCASASSIPSPSSPHGGVAADCWRPSLSYFPLAPVFASSGWKWITLILKLKSSL